MKTLRKERLYPVSEAVVWEALTNPAALREWLMPNNFRAEIGATFEFVTDPPPVCGSGLTKCKVVELVPLQRMTWSWQRDAGEGKVALPPMMVSWSLVREGNSTRLILEQTGLESQGWVIGLLMSIGWRMMLRNRLPMVLGHIRVSNGAAVFTPGAVPLAKRYYRCKSVPATYLESAAPSI